MEGGIRMARGSFPCGMFWHDLTHSGKRATTSRKTTATSNSERKRKEEGRNEREKRAESENEIKRLHVNPPEAPVAPSAIGHPPHHPPSPATHPASLEAR